MANVALLEGDNGRTSMCFGTTMCLPRCAFLRGKYGGEKCLHWRTLKRRASKYPLCGKAEDELNHLLFHCSSIKGLWEGLFSILGIAWVCPYSIKELFMGLNFFFDRKEGKKALAGGAAHLSSLGNLEGEEPYSF